MQKPNYPTGSRIPLLLAAIVISLLAASVAVPITYGAVDTFTSDKATYALGESVTLSGTATASENVGIQVNDPKETPLLIVTVVAASDGKFSRTFKLPADASVGTWLATAQGATGESKTLTFAVSTTGAPPPAQFFVGYGTCTPDRGFGPGSSSYAIATLVSPGQSVGAQWCVDGVGKLVHTAIHYDTKTGDPSQPLYGYANAIQEFFTIDVQLVPDPAGGRTFGGQMIMPNTPGIVYYRAHAIIDGKDYWAEEGTIQVVQPTAAPVDISSLQADVDQLQSEVASLKSEIGGLRSTVQGIQTQTGPAGPAGAAGAQGPPGPAGSAGGGDGGLAIGALIVGIVAIVIAGLALARRKK